MEKAFLVCKQKMKKKPMKKIIEMSNNINYTTGNLLDFSYFKENYQLISIDLSKQTKLKDPQHIIFFGFFLKNTGATMLLIIEKSEEATLIFLQISTTII